MKILLHIVMIYFFITNLHASTIRIIGGNEVAQNDEKWRFIVSLSYKDKHYCGGSLISSNWVLTAAHCIDHNQNGTNDDKFTIFDKVSIGSYNLNTIIKYDINSTIIHPEYNITTMENDIALIKLNKQVLNIKPVILDSGMSLYDGIASYVAGWGNKSTNTNDYPTNLMEVNIPLISTLTCQKDSVYGTTILEDMLCAGYILTGMKDSCQGDSGGPLISNNNDIYLQTGIVSWGYGCAEIRQPGVYTKVQNYISWIEEHTGLLQKTDEESKYEKGYKDGWKAAEQFCRENQKECNIKPKITLIPIL